MKMLLSVLLVLSLLANGVLYYKYRQERHRVEMYHNCFLKSETQEGLKDCYDLLDSMIDTMGE